MTDSLILSLDEVAADQLDHVGGKAANLARLIHLGLPVPEGFVITTTAYRAFLTTTELNDPAYAGAEQTIAHLQHAPLPETLCAPILENYQRLGAGDVAVRSSAPAEDLASASFAGQYDTFLNVRGDAALLRAVRACWASLWAPRAVAYRRDRGWNDRDAAIAVVVQRMVPAEAAGVAFTANPLTGNRDEMLISAVRGLGERLVSGQADADEWIVRESEAVCRRSLEGALTAAQAQAVAGLARQIADHFAMPQDIEWALADGALFVLQARPMTALPKPVTWRSPLPGGWMRNFRLGEWLPEPVTPLCDTWLLPRLEAANFAAQEHTVGVRPRPPYHVTVHGWYYTSPIGAGMPVGRLLRALLRHPLRVAAIPLSLIRPQFTDRVLLTRLAQEWHAELLPRYQRLVAEEQGCVLTASPEQLVRLIDEIASTAGEVLWSLSAVGGHAWKVERVLAAFYRQHLAPYLHSSHQELLRGLPTAFPVPPAHAVQSLDWLRPTLGESTQIGTTAEVSVPSDTANVRRQHLEAERRSAEAACREVLSGQPQLLRRFNVLLALAQRYAIMREEQAGWFTLGWPLLRRAALRLGEESCQRDIIAAPEDVFFLTRLELESIVDDQPHEHGALQATVDMRRREWEAQRRLSPPLTLGKPPGERLLASAAEVMRTPVAASQGASGTLKGMPASPGRATGPVRVVR